MKFTIERELPAPPRAVWPLLTDPVLMSRWSRAEVELVDPGDGGTPDGIGALRRVTLRWLGRTMRLEEVVAESSPPRRLVYRVVAGLPARAHRGEILVEERGRASRLRWQVEAEFPLPGMAALAERVLRAQLGASLDALAALAAEVARAPAAPSAPARPLDERAELPPLYAEAEAILGEQRRLADQLTADADPKRWFTRVYQFVTENQIRACRAGHLVHPAWVLRLIPRFHFYYADNLRRYHDRGRAPPGPWPGTQGGGRPEAHWRSAFRAMEQAERWRKNAFEGVLYGLAKGVQAHIEEDLPRALAEIYRWHYAGRCDYVRFRADYFLMGDIFRDAADRLSTAIPKRGSPLWVRLAGGLLPREARDALTAERFYDIGRQRRRAFQRGERLANLIGGSPDRAPARNPD